MAMSTLKQQFLELSEPDDDGVYRNGSARRMARTNLAMRELESLWNEAVHSVPFQIPDSGIGLAAVGSLARGQIGPASDLDLVLITADHVALSTTQLNEFANKLWYPIWDSGLDLDHSVRTVSQCESVTDHDLPAAMGWLNVNPIAGDRHLIETTATAILERWRKAARKRLPELLESANVRNERFDRMSYVNQPDIKESRGGLRDTVLLSALAASWLADRPHGRYDDAVERLLDVRDAIHLITRKDTNRLLTQYQAEVAAMLGLADPTLPEGERGAKSIDDLQTLLAGILHDIGKRPGVTDHAAEGARHAAVIVRRMGFDNQMVDWVRLLVREHLTLSDFASSRNPNDPEVGAELASRVGGDPQLLDMLFALTKADMSSLGATAGETISNTVGWSKWRARLVTQMATLARNTM